MAWGSKNTDATQLTSITDTEQFFDEEVTLGPKEVAHVQIEIDFGGTTDDAIISVYGTLDDATEDWDTQPIQSVRYPVALTDGFVSLLVHGVYRFRIGVKSAGSTDTITDADMSYRLDDQ
jgi:hypothetical protein